MSNVYNSLFSAEQNEFIHNAYSSYSCKSILEQATIPVLLNSTFALCICSSIEGTFLEMRILQRSVFLQSYAQSKSKMGVL